MDEGDFFIRECSDYLTNLAAYVNIEIIILIIVKITILLKMDFLVSY